MSTGLNCTYENTILLRKGKEQEKVSEEKADRRRDISETALEKGKKGDEVSRSTIVVMIRRESRWWKWCVWSVFWQCWDGITLWYWVDGNNHYWQCSDDQVPVDRLQCPRPRSPQVEGCSSSGRSRPARALADSGTRGVGLPEEVVGLVVCKEARWDEDSGGCWSADGCCETVEVCSVGKMSPGLDAGVEEAGWGRRAGRWWDSKPPGQSQTCWRGWTTLGRLEKWVRGACKGKLPLQAKARIEGNKGKRKWVFVWGLLAFSTAWWLSNCACSDD